MKTSKIAGITALALGLSVAALNPRATSTENNGLVLVSCTTRQLYVQRSSNGINSGIQSTDSLVDGVINYGTAQYMTEMAGNPFAGLGLMMIGSLRDTVKGVAKTAMDDACAGRDTTWLSDLSSSLQEAQQ